MGTRSKLMAGGEQEAPSYLEVKRGIPSSFKPHYRTSYVTDSYAFGFFGTCLEDVFLVHQFLYSVESDKSYPDMTREVADLVAINALKDLGLPKHASALQEVYRQHGARYYKNGDASLYNASPCEEALKEADSSFAKRAVDWA